MTAPRRQNLRGRATTQQARTPARQRTIDAFKARGRASVEQHRQAVQIVASASSWWPGLSPAEFYAKAKLRAVEMNAVKVNYEPKQQD
jgi:hypothetical protein